MKSLGIVSFFFSAIFTIAAQTNSASTATTMANTAARAMSLQDCIQEALAHNLDVQIYRYAPQVDLYNLRGVYGGYDLTWNISGEHSYNSTASTFVGTNLEPGYVEKSGSFNSSLGGTLPWGLQYDFSGNIAQQKQGEPGLPLGEVSPAQFK